MKSAIFGLICFTTACANVQHVPNPPRSMATLEPAETLDERKEQLTQHAFSAAKKTTTVTTSTGGQSNVQQYQDLTLLAQDGNYYKMEDYLPELQKAGIAKEADNPLNHYDAVNKERVYLKAAGWILLVSPIVGWLAGPSCTDPGSPDGTSEWTERNSEHRDCSTTGTTYMVSGLLGGMATSGAVFFYGINRMAKASLPGRNARGEAIKNRASWARAYNKKLMEKLGLQKAPSVTKSP
jgi:hypothetical protein